MVMKDKRKMKVAVVGTGMAGLVTAYLLTHDEQDRYAVTLFEQGERLALDNASVSLRDAAGRISRVDLPMRAFADGYYAHLQAMYDHIGVHYHAQRFLFAFSRTSGSDAAQRRKGSAPYYFIHASNQHVFPPMRPQGMGLLRYTAEIVFLAVCYLWLTVCAFVVQPRDAEDLGEYLARIRLPWYFVSHYVLPLMCSVATCTAGALLRFPAQDVMAYKRKSHGADHFVISGGVHTVQEKLVEDLNTVFSAQVVRVQPNGSGVAVSWRTRPGSDAQGGVDIVSTESFDRAVLAVAPDVVAQIFAPLQTLMSRIPTISVGSELLQPGSSKSRQARFSVVQDSEREGKYGFDSGSARLPGNAAEVIALHSRFSTDLDQPEATEAIHHLGSGARVVTGGFSTFDDREVLHRSRWTRVLRSVESRRILSRIFQDRQKASGSGAATCGEESKLLPASDECWTNGDGNVWLAGGWCWDGMVLLEGCVVSAARIARDFGVIVPWLQHGS